MDPIIVNALQQQQQVTAMQVEMAVATKAMDVQKQVGEALIGLIEGAAMQTPGKAIGLGANFDAYA